MRDSRSENEVKRPTECPFCGRKGVGTLAKVITANTCWRCRGCEATWTMAGLASKSRLPRPSRDSS